jgi:hypothetical protein
VDVKAEGLLPLPFAHWPLPAATFPSGLGGGARSSFLDHSKLLHFIHLHAHSSIFSFLDGAHNASVIALVHPTHSFPDHNLQRCPVPYRSPTPSATSDVRACSAVQPSRDALASNQAARPPRATSPAINHFLQILHLDRNVCAPDFRIPTVF